MEDKSAYQEESNDKNKTQIAWPFKSRVLKYLTVKLTCRGTERHARRLRLCLHSSRWCKVVLIQHKVYAKGNRSLLNGVGSRRVLSSSSLNRVFEIEHLTHCHHASATSSPSDSPTFSAECSTWARSLTFNVPLLEISPFDFPFLLSRLESPNKPVTQ